MTRVLFRIFTLREVRARPARTALTLLAGAIGVAAVVAVAVASATARQGFQNLFRASSGRADFEVVASTSGRFQGGVADELRRVPGVRTASPVLERPTILYAQGQRVRVLLTAVDPVQDAAVRDYSFREGAFPAAGGVALDAGFARRLKVAVGDEVKLLSRSGLHKLRVTGLFEMNTPLAVKGAFILMALGEGQRMFAKPGEVTFVYLVATPGADKAALGRALAAVLPPGLTLREPVTRTQLANQNMQTFELGLNLAAGLSLAVAFIVTLNAFFMNVAERRRQLAILRVTGATAGQIGRAILAEGLVMGLASGLLGIPLGVFAAGWVLRALEAMFDSPLPPAALPLGPLFLGAGLGTLTATLAAYLPARQAGRVPPLEALTAIETEMTGRQRGRLSLAGGVFWLAATAFLAAGVTGYLPATLIVAAAVLWLGAWVVLIPLAMPALSWVAAGALIPFGRPEAALARGYLLRRPLRAGLTVAVLFVGVSMSIALGNSVLNNLRDVRQYVKRTVDGDFFLRAMMVDMATGVASDLPAGVRERVRAMPGVEAVASARFASALIGEQQVIILARDLPPSAGLPADLERGDPVEARRALFDGGVLLGTLLAQRLGKKPGDTIELDTESGPQSFPVVGTMTEYLVGGLMVVMEAGVARRRLGIDGADVLLITADPSRREEVGRLLDELSAKEGLLLQSNEQFTAIVEGMIGGIEASLMALLAVGLAVTGFGVVNCLTLNVLEQTHEFGVLRAIGMTRSQVYRTVLGQAWILGVVSVALGAPVGLILSYGINLGAASVFGHLVAYSVRPLLVGAFLLIALVVMILSAVIPARRTGNINPLDALRYE